MLTQAFKTVGNLFLHQLCALCDRATPQPLCNTCWQQLQRCAQERPALVTVDALPIMAWGIYQGNLKRAIAALKYDNHPELATPLGTALGTLWAQTPLTQRAPLVVPIPMHHEKQHDRGFNQAELLAEAFCRQTGLKRVTAGLVRQKPTLPQFGLGIAERQSNMADAFVLGRAFQAERPQQPVLLLDDIYTTGTTVRIAAAVLRRYGISVCGVVAIARPELHQPSSKTMSL